MRKRIAIVLAATAMIVLVGCGGEKKENADKVSDNKVSTESVENEESVQNEKSVQNTESQSTDMENVEMDETPSLNVANDTFGFDELLNYIGVDETVLLKKIGAAELAESYETQLFGENVSITVGKEENIVQSIRLSFPGTDTQSAANAISEQLGQDGTESDGTIQWICDGFTIYLSAADAGCSAEIHK